MNSYEWWTGIVQTLGVVGLGLYVLETHRIRKINAEAIELPVQPRVSLSLDLDFSDDELLKAASEQRPVRLGCLTSETLKLYNNGAA